MEYLLFMIFMVVAALYASVGHGGASGYLGLLALGGFAVEFIRPTALMLNLLVAGVAFYQFYRNGYFQLNKTLPFILGSVPAAFVGGMITIPTGIYKVILGVFLIIAVLRMTIPMKPVKTESRPFQVISACLIGVAIGLVSGMIGIGGGIVLSPVIILLGWADLKTTAATSALFICVNSIAGLLGFILSGGIIQMEMYPVFFFAVTGAIMGGFLGSFKWRNRVIQHVLSLVLIIAAFKLIFFI